MKWNEMEWNGMEWNGVLRLSCVFNIPIKLGFNFMRSDAGFDAMIVFEKTT